MSANRAAVAVLSGDAYMVGYADRNVPGYTPTTYLFDSYDDAKVCAKSINEAWELTPDEANSIILSSMFPND